MRHSRIPLIITLLTLTAACSQQPQFDAQGTFEATEVTIAAEGTGKLLSLTPEQGDSVTLGEPLGLIDTLQLSLQRNELLTRRKALLSSLPDVEAQAASLREQIAGTVTERDRTARLLVDGAATRQQLDNLDTRLASLRGQLQALLATMSSSTASITGQAAAMDDQIAAINDRIARCVITSPLSGTVLAKTAEAGEVTAFGQPLLRVADMQRIYLRAYFTSDQLAHLSLGAKVTVTACYGGDSRKDYSGEITFIASQSEFTPKTIQTRDSRANLVYAVKIAVPNDGLLKLGLTGYVTLPSAP